MFRMSVAIAILGAATMSVLAADPPAPTAEDAKLAKLFREYLDSEFERHPSFATQQGNHDHDDRLDDLSPEARKKDDDKARQWLLTLPKMIDPKALSRDGQLEVWALVRRER
jgi:uncharacterized protein (DUF885 family)